MTTVEQDTIHQYLDGRDLLRASLTERGHLLHELEKLARAPQTTSSAANIIKFPLVRAQALLFELSLIGEHVDTLISEINSYAERCGQPPIQVMDAKKDVRTSSN